MLICADFFHLSKKTVGILLQLQTFRDTYCTLRVKLDVYLLPRGESQWGAAFSSCMCKYHAVSLLHLGKSTEEKVRVQPLGLLWRRCATG